MANLNFQQPPRSLANTSMAGRTTGGFGGSSLSGHVTPTSGMFPTDKKIVYDISLGGANYGQTQQPQLSPNRNAQLSVGGPALSRGGRANIFGQQTFERRAMQALGGGPMSNMGSFMQSGRGGYGTGGGASGFPTVFGGSGDTATPALLDPTEFPSLTNVRGQNDQSLPQTNPLQPPGSKPYGNFFTSCKVTNIPASMVNNQFGMVGLLTFIRAAESDPNLVTLALGNDLTGLGLNLNSQESLHPTFAGPFADHPCRVQDVECNVPTEYLINYAIKDKLSAPLLNKLQEDLLFFLFYTNIGDIWQMMAAAELYGRDWRFHIEEKIWITRIPGNNQGKFYYFDAQSWKRMSKDFQIDAEKLDKCPNISALVNMNGQSV
ncbi:regulator of gene activity isoform X5 [Bactrocera dorsalis]|uniref:Regulator of gene activity isoform X5 n=1 Tax=Bactrocera dorsalis TaxID=27457 RepID=A0ABM3J5I0_BACDO|nr:regulator of gene activity isoform X5 [Bactrocera dorsalis]